MAALVTYCSRSRPRESTARIVGQINAVGRSVGAVCSNRKIHTTARAAKAKFRLSDYSKELSFDRSLDLDSRVLEVVNELWNGEPLPLRSITTRLNEKYADDLQETVSGKRVGFVIRKVLGIRTRKRGGLFEILPTEHGRIESLLKRLGLEAEAA